MGLSNGIFVIVCVQAVHFLEKESEVPMYFCFLTEVLQFCWLLPPIMCMLLGGFCYKVFVMSFLS